MPAPRQQRRNNARGNVPFQHNATVPSLIPAIHTQGANDLQLTFGVIAPNITLNGIPAFTRVAHGTLPLTAGWDAAGELLTLTYDAPNIGASEHFTLPAHDTAFRGASGEYIAATDLATSPPPPTPAAIILTPGQPCAIGIVNVPTGNGLTCTVPSGPNPGDTFMIVVPGDFSSGCSITGVASGSPVPANTAQLFTYDGSNWNP